MHSGKGGRREERMEIMKEGKEDTGLEGWRE